MIRQNPHRLRAQASPLAPTIPLAVRIRNTASKAMIWCEVGQRQRGFSPLNQTLPISAHSAATVGAQRWHRQNPKSP
jgi:hypothetical protein